MIKESDYIFNVWCSGRQNCDGLLVKIKVVCLYILVYFTLKCLYTVMHVHS